MGAKLGAGDACQVSGDERENDTLVHRWTGSLQFEVAAKLVYELRIRKQIVRCDSAAALVANRAAVFVDNVIFDLGL